MGSEKLSAEARSPDILYCAPVKGNSMQKLMGKFVVSHLCGRKSRKGGARRKSGGGRIGFGLEVFEQAVEGQPVGVVAFQLLKSGIWNSRISRAESFPKCYLSDGLSKPSLS